MSGCPGGLWTSWSYQHWPMPADGFEQRPCDPQPGTAGSGLDFCVNTAVPTTSSPTWNVESIAPSEPIWRYIRVVEPVSASANSGRSVQDVAGPDSSGAKICAHVAPA